MHNQITGNKPIIKHEQIELLERLFNFCESLTPANVDEDWNHGYSQAVGKIQNKIEEELKALT